VDILMTFYLHFYMCPHLIRMWFENIFCTEMMHKEGLMNAFKK